MATDPRAKELGRVESIAVRPIRWHCLSCGELNDASSSAQCMHCSTYRPFPAMGAMLRQCPSCAELILATSRFCEWCGRQQPPLQPAR